MAGGIHPDIGTGASLAYSSSTFVARITEIQWSGISREHPETTHLGSTDARAYLPGDLYDPGELSLSIQYEPGNEPPISAAQETITLTFPANTAQGIDTAATLAVTASVSEFSFGVPLEDVITADVTFKCSGALTWTSATT